MMRVKYLGPRDSIAVGGFGPHREGEIKDYPDAVGEELLTGKRQKFEQVPEPKSPAKPKARPARKEQAKNEK
jgi:hypothetical protein